jgi:hypothetical protein
MFKIDAASGAPTDRASSRHRRDGRGLGPFTGGQLTVIIVTFAVLLLFPIGAWALTFSNVAITDPGGVNQAKVDAGKNLHTAIADPAGVNVAKVNALGQVLANVSGTVVPKPDPALLRSDQINFPDSNWKPVRFGGVAGAFAKTLVLAHIDTFGSGIGAIQFGFGTNNLFGNFCQNPFVFDAVDHPPTGSTELNFAGGVAVPLNAYLCIRDTSPTSLQAAAFLYGY